MTNMRAISTLNSLKDYYNDKKEDSYVGFDCEDNEALDLAIKALEQTDVLDKVRAEIMQVANQEKFHDEKWALGLRHAVSIIDKYKAESKTEQALAYADQDTLMPAT